MNRRRLVIVGVGGLVTAVYLLRLDRVAGLMVDDAWYVLLARSLARGDGYQLVNAPTPGGLPPNPPAFAALLSIVFRLADFPQNIPLLKILSIAAMLAGGAMTYQLARRRQWGPEQALGLAVATTLVPALVFLATSTVMAEGVFLCAQLATIALVERGHPRSAGFTAGLTVLVRSAGIALPVGVLLYFAHTRQWRRAAWFAGVVVAVVSPWLVYATLHQTTMAQRFEHGGAHAYSYGQEFWMRWAGDAASGTITVRELPARAFANSVDVFGRDVGGIVAPVLFRGSSESGQEVLGLGGVTMPGSMGLAPATMVLSFLLSAVVLAGVVRVVRRGTTVMEFVVLTTLLLIVLWPQWPFRFLLPLTPFVFVYLLEGVPSPRVARVLLLTIIGLQLMDHGSYIVSAREHEPEWLVDAADSRDVIAWLQTHAEPGSVIASTNPALVYLHTGHSTIAIDGYTKQWPAWQQRGVQYVVSFRPDQPPAGLGHVVRFQSARRGYWVTELPARSTTNGTVRQ